MRSGEGGFNRREVDQFPVFVVFTFLIWRVREANDKQGSFSWWSVVGREVEKCEDWVGRVMDLSLLWDPAAGGWYREVTPGLRGDSRPGE